MPAEPTHYLPLTLLLPLGLAGAPAAHLAFLGFLIVLRPTTTGNYCNCLASMLLGGFLLLDNNRIVCEWVYKYCYYNQGTCPRDGWKWSGSCSLIGGLP